ncbi:MAG: hypothetical protein LBS09_08905 [Bacteroidales bacterium]|jgi:hypothetical protein|nr:hypothetical protein [Bacteroidales bacterium]
MKKIFLSVLVIILVIALSSAIDKERYYYHNSDYSPIFMSREMLEQSVLYVQGAREVKNTGKVYYRAPYIYMNERYKGVHVINVANPENPVNEGFILAPGCIDMAVKDHILYLDNAVDLVSFDLNGKTVTNRIRNVFPEPAAPGYSYNDFHDRPENYILVEWRKKEP